MTNQCTHPVGSIPGETEIVKSQDWNRRLMEFVALVDDFNVRGQRDQINHPGFIVEFKFCPVCGAALDRAALGLLTYSQAFTEHKATRV